MVSHLPLPSWRNRYNRKAADPAPTSVDAPLLKVGILAATAGISCRVIAISRAVDHTKSLSLSPWAADCLASFMVINEFGYHVFLSSDLPSYTYASAVQSRVCAWLAAFRPTPTYRQQQRTPTTYDFWFEMIRPSMHRMMSEVTVCLSMSGPENRSDSISHLRWIVPQLSVQKLVVNC